MANAQQQCVIVMRHGARLDKADPDWESTAGRDRPYDPPLTDSGKTEAFQMATVKYRDKGIKKVVSSPFLRCLQTAQEACRVLDIPGIIIDNGLCEILSPSLNINEPPKIPRQDLNSYGINILQYHDTPLPKHPEMFTDAMKRCLASTPRIADQYYPENLLLVTHQYGVEQSLSLALGNESSYEARYCGHVILTRSSKGGDWKLDSKFRVLERVF